jgi:hypothetical protein
MKPTASRAGYFTRGSGWRDDAAAPRKSMLHSHHAWFHAAGAHALCGKANQAVGQLRRRAEHGLPNYRTDSRSSWRC